MGRTEVSVRLDGIVVAFYHLGMVPGILDLKDFAKPWIFMIFWGVNHIKNHENAERQLSDVGLRSSRPAQNDLAKFSQNADGFSAKKT